MVKRILTPEEKKLWKQITKQTKALRSEEEMEDEVEAPVKKKAEPAKTKIKPIPPRAEISYKPTPSLKLGNLDAIDGRNAERFRKGEYPIDATLDLHGMTYDKAYSALTRFMENQLIKGNRSLLIITGKGKEGTGLLKQSLPGWLAASDLRPMILALAPAKPKDGGSGAYYVLLKRKR